VSEAPTFSLAPAAAGRLNAAGSLTFATARAARVAGLAALKSSSAPTQIDCSGVTAADSAGLAVLLDWLAAAQLAGHKLTFSGLPPGMSALGRISEVSELLARGV
jgi:phospholipid transport system transporter-binding protein